MEGISDHTIHDVFAGLISLGLVAYGLYLLLAWLRRTRPDLSIGAPVAAAVGLRVFAAIMVGATGALGETLRGGDELGFLAQSHAIAETGFLGPAWTEALTEKLFNFGFATQLLILDSPDLALRITQAGIAVAGLALLATAVYELAGPRPALIAAWVIALEPGSVFFSTLLHKEPNMMLAGGLVAFGGAAMWKRGDIRSLLPIVLGCLIAVATRPYAGWFLIAAGAAITLHTGLRTKRFASNRPLILLAVAILFAAISAPTVWEASTDENLEKNVQHSQDANASDDSNLRLERVDFSTRESIIVNLPQRIRDIALRPFPWQLGNTSQRFGLMGTLFALTCFALLARELWRARGRIMERAGPLVYVAFLLLIAYSLSVGNAGTGFRYRTHIVAVVICLIAVLWELRTREADRRAPLPSLERGRPATQPSLATRG